MISNFEIIFLVLSYLLGSIPVGYLLTKYFAGKNILNMGSGNVGSTNVRRVAGKKLSVITQILDMLKGLLPVAIYCLISDHLNTQTEAYVFFLALASIMGHDFSIFLKFKGGKGVNTTLGASLLLAPISVFISVLLYFLVKWQFKYVSLGSIILAISLPISEYLLHGVGFLFYYLLVCMILILLLHRSNITRLLNHEELR
jgi:glycerol-3-phosphate acyltransferase PlsY